MAQQSAQPGMGAAPDNGPASSAYPWLGGANMPSMQGPAVNVPAMYAGMGGMGAGAPGGAGRPQIMPTSGERMGAPANVGPGMRPPVPGMQPGQAPARPAFGGFGGGSMPGIGMMPGAGNSGGGNQLGLLDLLSQVRGQMPPQAGMDPRRPQFSNARGQMPMGGRAGPVRQSY